MGARSRQVQALANPFTKLAKAISKNHGVRVVPSASKCATDGNVIHVPFAAEIAEGATLQTLHGMLDHELGHVRVEEHCKAQGIMGFLERMNNAQRRGDKTLATLMNVVEDVRIEIDAGKEFPGMKENLARLNERMCNLRVEAAEKGKHESLWREIVTGFIARARGFDHSWMTPKSRLYLDGCEDLVEKSRTLGSVIESEALAEELKERLLKVSDERREEAKKQREEAKRECEGGSSTGSDHAGELGDKPGEGEPGKGGKGEGQDDGDPSRSEDAEDEDGGQEGKGDGDEGDESEEDEPGELDGGPDFGDHRDELRDELEKALVDSARERGIRLPHPLVVELDRWRRARRSPGPESYEDVKDEVRGQIGALRQKQIARIQTQARSRLHVGLDDGDLDQTRLHEVATGAQDVYHEVRPGRQVNVAIQVLLDLSGSIGWGNCEHYMRRTLVALAESWEPIRGMSYDILGFHNFFHGECPLPSDVEGLSPGMQPDGVHYSRMPFEIINFKEYHERISVFRERFGEVTGHSDNCDHEAVFMAARRLSFRPEPRKILIVINDGEPACYGPSFSVLNQELKNTVRKITKAGIEVWGIGAGTDSPKEFYNSETGARNVCIDDLSTMAPRLISLFSKRIESVA